METIEQMLIRHEGMMLKPYICPAGKMTIGVGRNLEDTGITKDEAMAMLRNDIVRIAGELITSLPWVAKLDRPRYDVMINMAFNLGTAGLLKFEKFLYHMEQKQFSEAAKEMLDSKWAKQVPKRAYELSSMIRIGE